MVDIVLVLNLISVPAKAKTEKIEVTATSINLMGLYFKGTPGENIIRHKNSTTRLFYWEALIVLILKITLVDERSATNQLRLALLGHKILKALGEVRHVLFLKA